MGGRSIACLNARDRNLLGFRRDLLTAAAYGVDQFLFVYGDEPLAGTRTSELTVRTMIGEGRAYASDLAPGAAGRCASAPPPGCATAAWKRAADFFFVQIGFDLDAFLAWRAEVDVSCPVYAGVLVVPSVTMARRLSIPGLTVPADLLERLEGDRNAGVDAACELVAGLRDSGAFDGVHLIPWRATARWRPGSNRCSDRSPAPRPVRARHAESAASPPRRSPRRRPPAASRPPGRPGRRPGALLRPPRAPRCRPWMPPWPPPPRPVRPPRPGTASGTMSNFDAAERKTAGCGLPYSSSSAECTSAKRLPQAEVVQRGLDQAVLRRRSHRQGPPPPGAQVDGVLGTGLEPPFGVDQLNDPVDDGDRHLVGRRARPGVQPEPVPGHLVGRTCPWSSGSRRRFKGTPSPPRISISASCHNTSESISNPSMSKMDAPNPARRTRHGGATSLKRRAAPRCRPRWSGLRAPPAAGSAPRSHRSATGGTSRSST